MKTKQRRTIVFALTALTLTWTIVAETSLSAQETQPTQAKADRFTSAEGGFSINFPVEPVHTQGTIIASDGKEVAEERFIAGTQDDAIVVFYQKSDEANGKPEAQILDLIDSKTNEFLKLTEGFIKKKQAIKINGTVPAYTYTLGLNGREGAGQMTACFNDGKLYRIGAFGSNEFVTRQSTREILDSFRLVNQPSGDASPQPPLQQNKAEAFVSLESGFQINFPTRPNISVHDLNDGQGDKYTQTQFESSAEQGSYMVSVQDADESIFETPAARKLAFDSTRDRLRAALEGEVREDRDATVGGTVPARELLISIPRNSGEYRTQVFFANQHFYQIIAVGTKEFANSAETLRIMRSFALLAPTQNKDTSAGLTNFDSAFGRFGIQLLVKPVYSRAVVNIDEDIKLVRHQYISGQRPQAVFVTFVDLPDGVTESNGEVADFFQTVATSLASEFDGELASLKRIDSSLPKNGWELRIKSTKADKNVYGHLFVEQGRFYQLLAVGHADFVGSSTAATILSSFATNNTE